MFLSWQRVALGSELSQTAADAETSVAWLDYIVDVAELGCLIRISEELVVLVLLLSDECLNVLASLFLCLGLLSIQYGSSTRCTHNGNLG